MNIELATNAFFEPIVKLIYEIGEHLFEVKQDEAGIVVYKSLITDENKYPITFIFWEKENRFSFFVFNFEVLDVYLNSEQEAKDVEKSLRLILANQLERISICSKNGEIKKEIVKYKVIEENVKKDVSEYMLNKFIYPWTKTKRIIHIYDNWTMNE